MENCAGLATSRKRNTFTGARASRLSDWEELVVGGYKGGIIMPNILSLGAFRAVSTGKSVSEAGSEPDPARRLLLTGAAGALAFGVLAAGVTEAQAGHSRRRSRNDDDDDDYHSRRRSDWDDHSRSRSERYRHSRWRSGPGWGRDDCAYLPVLGLICP